MSQIIITAAITGSIHIPTQSEYLPITPDQIVEDAVKAHAAGAAIAHIHVRDPESGKPTADADLFEEVHVKIKKRCDLILLPTTGGGPNQSVEEKLIPIARLKPEMCSFDPAPFNLGIFEMGKKYKGQFIKDWEEDYLEFTKTTMLMRPTLQDDIVYAETMLKADTKPEFEIYELGHIGYVTWLMEQNLVKLPPTCSLFSGPYQAGCHHR
jgi:uncharacterized protein (DUF849 family)